MRVHVVVVTWNGWHRMPGCLESLRAVEAPPLTVHVVDNGSRDGTAELVEGTGEEIRLHRLPRNLGFAAGANAGIRAALEEGATHVLLMNDDARLRPDAVDALARAAERRPDCGLYGGRIYRSLESGVLWCCGVSLGWWPNLARLRGHGRRNGRLYTREEEVDALTGCGLLIAREVVERVGLLDEGYWVYVEDADLCARARRAGFRPLYVPGAVLEHPGSGSTGGGYSPARKYLTAHGSVRFLRRHGTAALWTSFLLLDLLPWPLLLLAALPRGRTRGALQKGRGLLHGLLGRPPDQAVVGG